MMGRTNANPCRDRLWAYLLIWGLGCGVALAGCGGKPPLAWPERAGSEACPIRVTGSRFEWSFRFPGADGRFGTEDDLVSHRQLHLPRGRAVDLKLTSTDFIYTLSLPEMELKEIAVPELVHTMRIDAQQVGSYRLLSDPMCAVRFSHDEEMGRMEVEDAEAFRDWLATLVP
tara:strand:+ start:1176 stop:1691 length:516 start_codon:yes stop_codon:yes gene_type:complete